MKEVTGSDYESDYKKEIFRKSFHISSILTIPLIYIFLSKHQMLIILIPFCLIVIAVDHYRHKVPFIGVAFNRIFGKILREKELKENSWTGSANMALSALIVFIIAPKIIAICAFSILAISDGLAALVGKKIVSKKFFEKTTAGSIAFGVSAYIILLVCGFITNQTFGYYLFGTFAVLATTIIEARPSFFNVDDNLTIPLMFALVMVFFGFVWGINY